MAETYHPRGVLIDGYAARAHPLYNTWASMKARCNNPSQPGYENYGGRGITYCERWAHFANFVEDMGPNKPFDGATIERKDNSGNYTPENCVWADKFQQMRNRRTFKNSQSGETGVTPIKSGFNARYDDRGVRYDLGNFDTVAEASATRSRFIELHEAGDPAAVEMLTKGNADRRLRRDSSTGVKGITAHAKGDGYLVRKTINGERRYLGFAKTFEKAVAMLRGAE